MLSAFDSPIVPTLAMFGGVAAAAATTAVINAAATPGSNFFGPVLVAGNDPREVALTFDDGPNGDTTLRLLELLAVHKTRATFFLVGQHVAAQPEVVRAVHAAGHLVGNHTWTHPWLVYKPARVIREELSRCSKAIEDVIGEPVRYFRPPHGARRWAVIDIAQELGLTTVQWNVMGMDWRPIGVEGVLKNVLRGQALAARRGRGANILLHDGDGLRMGADRSTTLAATEALLGHFAATGKRVVTVDAWG